MQELAAINTELEKWIDYVDVKPQSRQTYGKAMTYFFNYLNANHIKTPTRQDVKQWRDALLTNHEAATVRLYLAAVRLFFRYLASLGIYPNITDQLKGPKQEQTFSRGYLTQEQGRQLLSTIDRSTLKGKRDFAVVRLMLTTGLRTVEVVRADVKDIQAEAGQTVLYVLGKGRDAKTEYVKLGAQTLAAIQDYLNARERGLTPLFTSTSNHTRGKRLDTRAVRAIVQERLTQAGLKTDRLSAHSLRHTAATSYLLQGASLEAVKRVLRHKSINTTLIYAHALSRAAVNCELLADASY